MAGNRLFQGTGKVEIHSAQQNTVAEEVSTRIKKQIGMIAGSTKFIDAYSKLSSMINNPDFNDIPISDIITIWKDTPYKNNETYNDILFSTPPHSNHFLSEAVDFLFDQRNFVDSIEKNFGIQKPNAILQQNTTEYKKF